MPRTGWIKEDNKKYYWGQQRSRIDLTRDEEGNWTDADGVRYTTFDVQRAPLLLLRFVPYCPECVDTCMIGFLNWEKNPEGEGGFAFRHTYHFWYEGEQMWGYPPPVRSSPLQPGIQPADLPTPVYYSEDDKSAYTKGREAFTNGIKVWNNPNDGRTTVGKSWVRGWEAARAEEADKVESQA